MWKWKVNMIPSGRTLDQLPFPPDRRKSSVSTRSNWRLFPRPIDQIEIDLSHRSVKVLCRKHGSGAVPPIWRQDIHGWFLVHIPYLGWDIYQSRSGWTWNWIAYPGVLWIGTVWSDGLLLISFISGEWQTTVQRSGNNRFNIEAVHDHQLSIHLDVLCQFMGNLDSRHHNSISGCYKLSHRPSEGPTPEWTPRSKCISDDSSTRCPVRRDTQRGRSAFVQVLDVWVGLATGLQKVRTAQIWCFWIFFFNPEILTESRDWRGSC
jgi:hypothetical protein